LDFFREQLSFASSILAVVAHQQQLGPLGLHVLGGSAGVLDPDDPGRGSGESGQGVLGLGLAEEAGEAGQPADEQDPGALRQRHPAGGLQQLRIRVGATLRLRESTTP